MSEPPSLTIHTDTGTKFLGLEPGTWIKLVIGIIVASVILSIFRAFQGAGGTDWGKDLGKAFGNICSALAFATEYWYLFLVIPALTPFLTAGGKWAANKISETLKTTKDPKIREAVANAIVVDQLGRELSEHYDPVKAAKQDAARSKYDDATKDPKDKDKVEEELKNRGVRKPGDVPRPPVPPK